MSEDIEKQLSNRPSSDNTRPKDKFFESNAGDGTTVFDQYLHGIPLVMCLISCFACLFLIGLDQTIVITLLETVGNKFNAYDKIGWFSSGYMLTMAVFAATWGKISIIFGRKWSLLIALVIFEAGSLMCALASSAGVLIGGRVLAGIGGGGIQTLTFIICSELTPIDKRSLVFVVLGLAFATSSVLGPLIGGAFTKSVSWRWCFYINLPIGGLAGSILGFFFRPPKTKGSLKDKFKLIDYTGTCLLTIGLVLFLLALTFGGTQYAWNSGAVISLFILGGIFSIVFCIWNFKFSQNPIIPWNIVRVPQVIVPVISLFLVFYCFMGAAIYVSTYFQIIKGYGAWKTGVHLLPMIIPVVLGGMISGILINRTRMIKPYACFGGICGSVGFGCLTLLKADSSPAARIGLLILPGVYSGIALQTSMLSSQLHAPKEPGSTILTTSLINFFRALGGVLGSDLSQAVFNSSFKNKIKKIILNSTDDAFKGFGPKDAAKLISSPDTIRKLSPEARELVEDAIMKSIKNVFILSTSLACLSCLAMFCFSNKKIPEGDDIMKQEPDEDDYLRAKGIISNDSATLRKTNPQNNDNDIDELANETGAESPHKSNKSQ